MGNCCCNNSKTLDDYFDCEQCNKKLEVDSKISILCDDPHDKIFCSDNCKEIYVTIV